MKHFSEIIKDNRSGSVRIVNNLIKELSIIIEMDAPEDSRGNLDNSVIEGMKKVLYHHRGMPVLFHFINEFLLKIDEDYSKNNLILFLNDYNDYKDKWGILR